MLTGLGERFSFGYHQKKRDLLAILMFLCLAGCVAPQQCYVDWRLERKCIGEFNETQKEVVQEEFFEGLEEDRRSDP